MTVRFIVHAQLPPALAKMLVEFGYEAEHVIDLNFQAVGDSVIWNYALKHGAAILTKDEDFPQSLPSKCPHTGGGVTSRRERQSQGALEMVHSFTSQYY